MCHWYVVSHPATFWTVFPIWLWETFSQKLHFYEKKKIHKKLTSSKRKENSYFLSEEYFTTKRLDVKYIQHADFPRIIWKIIQVRREKQGVKSEISQSKPNSFKKLPSKRRDGKTFLCNIP